MPQLTSSHELWKGLTDLPLAVAPLILFFLLRRDKGAQREWKYCFLLLAASAAMGTAVHCFVLPEGLRRGLWVMLFALMFELVRAYTHRIVCYIRRREETEKRAVRLIELLLYLAAAGLNVAVGEHGIYFFVVFSALLIVRMTVCAVKSPDTPRRFWTVTGILAAGLALQALKAVFPFGVVLGHVAVLIALFLVYVIAREKAAAAV